MRQSSQVPDSLKTVVLFLEKEARDRQSITLLNFPSCLPKSSHETSRVPMAVYYLLLARKVLFKYRELVSGQQGNHRHSNTLLTKICTGNLFCFGFYCRHSPDGGTSFLFFFCFQFSFVLNDVQKTSQCACYTLPTFSFIAR